MSMTTWRRSLGLKWAVLVPKASRPDILNTRHRDWFILRNVKRYWFAFLGYPPVKVSGTAYKELAIVLSNGFTRCIPRPIPRNGQWWIGKPFYFAFTTKNGWHFRIGLRWDNIDGYYQLTFTVKKVGE